MYWPKPSFLAKIGENHSSSLKRSSLPGLRGWQTRDTCCVDVSNISFWRLFTLVCTSQLPPLSNAWFISVHPQQRFSFKIAVLKEKLVTIIFEAFFLALLTNMSLAPTTSTICSLKHNSASCVFFAFYLWQIRINKNPSSIKNQQFWSLTVIAQK